MRHGHRKWNMRQAGEGKNLSMLRRTCGFAVKERNLKESKVQTSENCYAPTPNRRGQ